MAGIYLHVPFCSKACHYCDFHFSTILKNKSALIDAMEKEIELQKDFFGEAQVVIETIYFGGGTPSLLLEGELNKLLEKLHRNFSVIEDAEITLEANPDDLILEKIKSLKRSGINRLSIGIQSFRDQDLKLMNRSHNSEQAKQCVSMAQAHGFDNISIDLIYGIPELSNHDWEQNLKLAIDLNVNHISSYCLTVEEKTALDHFIKKGKIKPPDEDIAAEQFFLMMDFLEQQQFQHYEISNFSREGWYSRHNSSYWEGKPYLGLGPSAHSFNGQERFWNISNNNTYIKKISQNILPRESETIDLNTAYNEYILTALRTQKGIGFLSIKTLFGETYYNHCLSELLKISNEKIIIQSDSAKLTREGKLFADGIAANLFVTS
jgi:oxygen-independent coproporphyrinogen III oxidase